MKECEGAQCWVQEFGGVEWTQEFAGGVQCHTQEQSGPHCTLQGFAGGVEWTQELTVVCRRLQVG